MTTTLTATLLLVAGAAAGAAEFGDPDDMRLHDLRVQVGLPPAKAHVVLARDGVANAEDDASWSRRGRWSLIYVPRISRATYEGAGLCMVELSSARYASDSSAVSEQLVERTAVLDLHLGMGWAIFDRTALETTVFGGGGTAWQEGHFNRGVAWEAGFRAGVTMAPWACAYGSPVFGLAVIASYGQFRNDATLNGSDYHIDVVTKGLTPAAQVGWRF